MKMDIDPSSAEKPERFTRSSCDDPDLLGQVRSYTCSFCKRGFSNAQALGGHMNIHRKDRARLKEHLSSQDNNVNPISDIAKRDNQPSLSVDEDEEDGSLQQELPTKETIISCTQKRASPDDDEEIVTDPEDQLQLSLFTEPSSSSNDKEKNDRVSARHAKRSSMNSRIHAELLPGLDLELRLGPEPPETSKKG